MRDSRVARLAQALAAIAVVAVVPFVANDYYLNVLIFCGLYGIMALGLNLLVGYTGQISFGHNAFVGLGAYASAILTVKLGWPVWLALVAALALTAVVALAIGYPTLRLRGHYLAMGTSALGMIGFVLFSEMEWLTEGFMGISGVPPFTIGPWAIETAGNFFYLTWGLVLLVCYGSTRLIGSRAGRALRAIRGDETAARAMGIATTGYRVQIFVISAVIGAAAGSLFAHWVMYVSPEPFSLALAVQLLVMLFIGGVGTIWGPIVGSAVVTFATEATSQYQAYSQLIFGIVLVLVLIFAPRGVVGEVKARLGARLFRPAVPAVSTKPSEPNRPRSNDDA